MAPQKKTPNKVRPKATEGNKPIAIDHPTDPQHHAKDDDINSIEGTKSDNHGGQPSHQRFVEESDVNDGEIGEESDFAPSSVESSDSEISHTERKKSALNKQAKQSSKNISTEAPKRSRRLSIRLRTTKKHLYQSQYNIVRKPDRMLLEPLRIRVSLF